MTITGRGDGKARRKISCLLFDLDDTLYRSSVIAPLVLKGIHGYMTRHLNFSEEEAVSSATELYIKHGTTLAGLMASGHKIDYDHWHSEIHYSLLPYASLLQPDPALREMLFSMDLPKYVFTNADKTHADICLQRLGIQDCFKGVFHFEFLAEASHAVEAAPPGPRPIICKPSAAAYELVFKRLGVAAEEVLFFDDSARNIRGAHELGVMTVMVGTDQPVAGADLVMPDLHHLPKLLPELLDQPGMIKDVALGHEHEHMITAAAS